MNSLKPNSIGLAVWQQMLDDTKALLHAPIAHHRELVHLAYELRDTHAVDDAALADMLELSSAALEYAQEIQLEPSQEGAA
ncbi:hypothetical protein DZC75_20560 [Pseudomonas parafulva]|uniref:Uncharacterized protein n=1 Tax=Pseudomonas parafulva TaxID=157782 RepID=A0AAI8PD06_9PSED|nr:hypothetical protein [Pseudomonas parafulva]AXO90269.1 hypothetical protein DZC75_20560 [Pseudomonas parafulva]